MTRRAYGAFGVWFVFSVARTLLAEDVSAGFQTSEAGVRVERIADSELAPDIYSLTFDRLGRIVVSGRGYIRTLVDSDGDGALDRAIETWKPKTGAHSLLCDQRGLWFVGGRGLERLEDVDGDGRADGPPRLVLAIGVGGEHSAHGIRRGADGDLYFILGNHAGFKSSQIAGPSPIHDPYAGLLLALAPDASRVAVIAEGMRNTYDFDFGLGGDVFSFDSDGERDEGLPWYRPCRLYHLSPGADCGWRSSGSGKVPNDAFDTIAPVAEVGRGSPTGVVTYAHRQLPARFRGGVFALDWTFGRVLFFAPRAAGGTFTADVEEFVAGKSTTHFAPTDIEVAPDGALIVSSGGRGLAGAVYRISFGAAATPDAPRGAEGVERVLAAPQPHAAWSRSRWHVHARALPVRAFVAAVSAADRSQNERMRALDVLGEFHPKRFLEIASQLAEAPPALAARSLWWRGRLGEDVALSPPPEKADARVQRAWLDALQRGGGVAPASTNAEVPKAIAHVLRLAGHDARRVRQAAARVVARSEFTLDRAWSARHELTLAMARVYATTPGNVDLDAVETSRSVLQSSTSREERLDALRIIECAFERLQISRRMNAQFYENWDAVDLAPYVNVRQTLAPELLRAGGDRDPLVAREGIRLLSLLQVAGAATLDVVLDRLGLSTPPGEDVLTLSFAARLGAKRTLRQRERIVDGLLGIAWKVKAGRVGRDRRWQRYVGAVAATPVRRRCTAPG